MAEWRETDPNTGGMKNQKPEQMSLVPVEALEELARVYEFGARKYDRDNWRKGYAWHLSYDAAQRHMMKFWSGEDRDPDSGLLHVAHAMFHMAALCTFVALERGTDDRPSTEGPIDLDKVKRVMEEVVKDLPLLPTVQPFPQKWVPAEPCTWPYRINEVTCYGDGPRYGLTSKGEEVVAQDKRFDVC